MSVSLTLDPKQLGSSADEELDLLQEELAKIAQVSHRKGLAIVSLICNTEKTSEILQRVRGKFVSLVQFKHVLLHSHLS